MITGLSPGHPLLVGRMWIRSPGADRALDEDEAEGAFEKKTVEMMGTKERAEVKKEAGVVGKVEIQKEAKERQKTVSDTVRKSDVEVEQVGAGSKKK